MKLPKTAVAVDVTKSRYASFEIRRKARSPQVVFAGFETVLPSYRIDRASFPTFAIELVVGGSGLLRLNGADHPLRPGTLFTYGPDVAHFIATDARSPLRKYFVDLAPDPGHGGTARLSAGLVFETSMPDRIASLLDGLLDDAAEGFDLPEIRSSTACLLLALAARSLQMPPPPTSAAYARYLEIKSHIEANYFRSGCVAEFARALHIDNTYLTRLFQRFSNESPYRFLTRLRMTRASHLLLRHNQSIQQVADSLNFANPFHFSTLFRRYFGIAPSRSCGSPERGNTTTTRQSQAEEDR